MRTRNNSRNGGEEPPKKKNRHDGDRDISSREQWQQRYVRSPDPRQSVRSPHSDHSTHVPYEDRYDRKDRHRPPPRPDRNRWQSDPRRGYESNKKKRYNDPSDSSSSTRTQNSRSTWNSRNEYNRRSSRDRSPRMSGLEGSYLRDRDRSREREKERRQRQVQYLLKSGGVRIPYIVTDRAALESPPTNTTPSHDGCHAPIMKEPMKLKDAVGNGFDSLGLAAYATYWNGYAWLWKSEKMEEIEQRLMRKALKVYVGNLPLALGLDEAELGEVVTDLFIRHNVFEPSVDKPPVLRVWFARDRGQNYGFIEFTGPDYTNACCSLLHGIEIKGRNITVRRPKDFNDTLAEFLMFYELRKKEGAQHFPGQDVQPPPTPYPLEEATILYIHPCTTTTTLGAERPRGEVGTMSSVLPSNYDTSKLQGLVNVALTTANAREIQCDD